MRRLIGAHLLEGIIVGRSTMAELVRRFDWRTTPLGAVETWSETLLSQVNLLLCSQFPATLTWGKELTFFYNDAAIPAMGTKHPEALGGKEADLFKESWERLAPDIHACFRRGETPIRENVPVPVLQDGRLQDAYFSYSMIPVYERGEIMGVRGVHENTTERVFARLERDALAAQLAQILDATSDGVVCVNSEWSITYMNTQSQRILRSPGSLVGTNLWASCPHQADPESPYVKFYQRAMHDRVEGSIEAFYPAPLEIYVQVDVRLAREGIVIFIRDVTERKAVEAHLGKVESREKERLQELFEGAPAFLAVIRGPEHIFEMANTSYREMMGGRDLIGYRVIDCVPEVKETGWIKILDGVYRTGVAHSERSARLMLAPSPGEPLEERFVDYVYQPRRGADGQIFGIIALGIDVTDQRRAERALIQTEKLAVVGRLASSIAHEINNPLGAALNYLYLAGVSESLREVRECIGLAEGELRRVSVISTQTLQSQRQSATPSTTSFRELSENVLHLYRGRIKVARIEIKSEHRAAGPLLCMEGEIRQALGNLIGNAVDAMYATGGRLVVKSRAGTDWKTGRKGNKITIADTGAGIPAGIVKHIFDPFFTTKGSLGNGLGLWITRDIIGRHEGEIRLRSVTGRQPSGTVFTLFLPEIDAVVLPDGHPARATVTP